MVRCCTHIKVKKCWIAHFRNIYIILVTVFHPIARFTKYFFQNIILFYVHNSQILNIEICAFFNSIFGCFHFIFHSWKYTKKLKVELLEKCNETYDLTCVWYSWVDVEYILFVFISVLRLKAGYIHYLCMNWIKNTSLWKDGWICRNLTWCHIWYLYYILYCRIFEIWKMNIYGYMWEGMSYMLKFIPLTWKVTIWVLELNNL